MTSELEGLETIAGGVFAMSTPELVALARRTVESAQLCVSITAEADELMRKLEIESAAGRKGTPAPLVAPPIPGPPLGPFKHLFRKALAQTQRMRPAKVTARGA